MPLAADDEHDDADEPPHAVDNAEDDGRHDGRDVGDGGGRGDGRGGTGRRATAGGADARDEVVERGEDGRVRRGGVLVAAEADGSVCDCGG